MARKHTGPAASSGEDSLNQAAGDGRYVQNLGGISHIVRMTQATYNALSSRSPNILYVIVG